MPLASARSYALLSVAAALLTIALKTLAWAITGSVGLLSDALESCVNLVAALTAFWALGQASKPADRNHSFGHSKAEYFSSGLESALIVVAAIGIIWTAAGRLLNPVPISSVDLGLTLSLIATALNGAVAWLLLRAARRFRSNKQLRIGFRQSPQTWIRIHRPMGQLSENRCAGLPAQRQHPHHQSLAGRRAGSCFGGGSKAGRLD